MCKLKPTILPAPYSQSKQEQALVLPASSRSPLNLKLQSGPYELDCKVSL